MTAKLDEFEAQALTLPPKARAALAEKLIASLDALDETENERLWLDEADRRYQQYKEGRVEARAAQEVLRDARAAIR